MNALQEAQKWAAEITGASNEGDTPLVMAAQYARAFAAIAQAEAAERQAAAMERIANHLEGQHYMPPWVQDLKRLTDKMSEYVILPEERAALAQLVQDQRAEDNASYNAGIAGGLHR